MIKKPSEVNDVNWLIEWHPEIAQKCTYPCGQWILQFDSETNLDQKWEEAVNLYRKGSLGGIHSMKISTEKNEGQKILVLYGPESNQGIEIIKRRNKESKLQFVQNS